MACSRGKASPDAGTKLALFAASSGYCQNPACNRELFIESGGKRIHIAEMAHVIAANEDGPRAQQGVPKEELGSFDNLLMLCPACHTEVDKAEERFPVQLLLGWKRDHAERLARIFGATRYDDRSTLRRELEPLLAENRAIFEDWNPDLDYKANPEAEEAATWQRRVRERIIPNNRRLLALLDVNRELATEAELRTIEDFRQHIYDMEAHHLTDSLDGEQRRFPPALSHIMAEA
jgi:hypothetical protein